MSTQVDTDTTERLARNDDDYLYGWQGTTNYRMKVSVLLAGYVQGEGVASGNYVVSGGGVVWEQDYDYTVGAASYVIQGTAYSSPETPITLDPADATNDRIDIITVDVNGDVVVLTGTPAANPQAPDVDPDTQLQLTFVLVPALSTDPGVTITVLYQENAGTPTEWAYSDSGATLSGADTAQPYAGTIDIAGTSCVNGNQFFLTAAAPISLADQNFLSLRVRPNGTWPSTKSLRLVWRSSGVVVGNVITLGNGTYGLDTSSATYQTIAIPIADFGVSGTVDSLRVRVNGGGAAFSFYVDNIELQSGIAPPSSSYQPLDATLTALAAANWAANALPIGSGSDTVAQVSFAANTFPARASTGNLVAKAITDFGLSLVDDATAGDARTTLGLGTLATQSGTFSGTSSGTNTGDQNLFSTIAVSGQSNVVADSASDTLTLVAGTNVTITTNAGTDTVTIAASGGGGTNVVDANWFNVKASPYNALGDGSTDDTAAIQAAIDACETYGGGTVYFPKGIYVVNGALQDTSRSNAQLLLPRRDYADTEAITIFFRGEAAPPSVASVIGATPLPDNLSVIKGTLNTGTAAQMIGAHGPSGTFNNFTNILLVMRDLTIQMPANPVLTALDLSCVAQIDLDQVLVHAGSLDVASISAETTATSFGIKTPANGNGALTRLGVVNVVGFYNGYQIGEHCVGQMPVAWGCKNAYVFIAADHASAFVRLMAVHCQKVLTATGDHYTTISEMNIEHAASGTWVPVYDIDDSNGYIRGNARWHVVLAVAGVDDTLSINGLSGANNGLRLRLERIGKWFNYGLTDAASIVVPAYISDQFSVTLAGNRTLTNPTGLQDGQVLAFRIKQDGTGSRTLAYGNKYKFAGGTAPVLTTTAAAVDFLTCQYDITAGTLMCSMLKDVK